MAIGLDIQKFKGKIIIVAQDGQADKLESIFKQMRDHSVSDASPGCLTYRVNRNGNDFLIFEGFQDAGSVTSHIENPKLKAWVDELKGGNFVARPPQVKAFEEL